MRKLSLLTFLILSISLNAQFGVKGGLVQSGFATDSEAITEDNQRTGFTLGVVYNHCLGCDFSLQPEINYTQKGEDYVMDGASFEVGLAYIDVPINVRYKILDPLYLYVGPEVSFLLNQSSEFTLGGTTIEFGDGDAQWDAVNFGFNAGLGLHFDRFFIDARYARAFTSIDEAPEDNDILIFSEEGLKNYSLQFTVGVYF